MIDRLVHHAEVIALKGDSYRLLGRDRRSSGSCVGYRLSYGASID